MSGHFSKAGVEAGRGVWEFRATDEEIGELSAGSEIGVNIFESGQIVDVQASSKGKGFAGGIKRHGFGGLRATHGVSISHRSIGSTGQNQTPGRVFPGKKMPGQMGDVKVTQQNLEIVRVDEERNMILVKGSIPGSKGSDVIIRPAVKKS
jgi:large subunit ribosomal protein L3